ncbi:MAG: HNH endonuclease, partial [Terracoccus sp.]
MGDRQLVGHVKAIAYRLDPESVLNRARTAEGDRRVSVRPAPDTMAYLTALLPVAQAVAAYAALTAAADTARAGGDERGKGQVMADTLVERLTGQATAQDVDVEVQVVITDEALFGGDETPGQVPGYGTVPAGWVRDLLTPHDHTEGADAGAATAHKEDTNQAGPGDSGAASAADGGTSTAAARFATTARSATGVDGAGLREHARVWIRRLYTHPTTGTLVAMDSTRR